MASCPCQPPACHHLPSSLPPCLLSDVHRSQDTRCDRSAVAPASCSLWPCCELRVTSCLSLCLFLALPEGPCGTGRGSDGSAADPHGYGPPGSGPGCLPASAACADGHRDSPWSSCRVPGPFSVLPALNPQGTGTVTAASRLTVSPDQPGTLNASHSWLWTKSLTHAHTCFTQVHTNPTTYRHGQRGLTCPNATLVTFIFFYVVKKMNYCFIILL